MGFRETLAHYTNAGFPALWVQTHEEPRVIRDILAVSTGLKPPRPVFTWSITEGWKEIGIPKESKQVARTVKAADPISALRTTLPAPGASAGSACPEESILVLKDFHAFSMENPQVKRVFRDILPALKASGRLLIFLSPTVAIPIEWEKEIQVLPYLLPDREELGSILDAVVGTVGGEKNAKISDRVAVLESARMLTGSEAENAFALALVKHKSFSISAIKTVQSEKAAAVRKTGILEFFETEVGPDDIGGLDYLKEWLLESAEAFSDTAKAFGLRPRKGVLITGVPGGGKSLTAKATSNILKKPLLRLDYGRVFGGTVGKSEENMRSATAMADAMGGVLWIDEIEKGAAGMGGSGNLDSGVGARVGGTLLTWMQEQTSTFVIATSNDVSKLPAELIRRFDEVFAVDLATYSERKAIFSIHIKARKRDVAKFDLDELAKASSERTGAEIEKAVDAAMFRAFMTKQELSTALIIEALGKSKPISVTSPEKVQVIREWIAAGKARPASIAEDAAPAVGPRRVRRIGVPSGDGDDA